MSIIDFLQIAFILIIALIGGFLFSIRQRVKRDFDEIKHRRSEDREG